MDPMHNYPNELGKVEIAPEVIQIISGLAASEVDGVVGLSGGVVGDINQWLGRKNLRQGIRVEFNDMNHIVVSIVIQYGYNIPEVGRQVQEKIKTAIETMTGITIHTIVVRVEGIKFPQQEKSVEIVEPPHRVK